MESHRSCVTSNTMKKNQLGKKPSEGPVYMEYKSYKAKPGPSRVTSVTKPAPLSSGETVAVRAQQYADLQNELKDQKEKQTVLLRSIKKLQTENEQFKNQMVTSITPRTHHQLGIELEQSQRENDSLQHEIQRLFAANQEQIGIVQDLKQQVVNLQNDQGTLRDQIKVELEAKVEQANVHERLTSQIHQLQTTIETLTLENQTLQDEKELLQDRLDHLQHRVGEMDRKIETISVLQKKLKSYESQLQQTMQQNKTLFEQNDSYTRFVKILENDMQTVKNQNSNFTQQNKQLRKQLSGLKKSLEHLRQKYDEVNKENKLLKEKESRYMYHEKFNVGKYAHKIPSLFDDFKNDNVNSSQHVRNQNYMRAAKNAKSKSTTNDESDQRYYLLHRQENVKDNKSDSTEIRKKKK